MIEGVVELRPTSCAICGTEDNYQQLYPATFQQSALNPIVFSARRLPDRIHYRVVRCRACGLVRSDPVADPEFLRQLYARSEFSYADEVPNLRRTYGRCLRLATQLGSRMGSLLEIGCGNGFFLHEALAQGFRRVVGVEPSRRALTLADEGVASSIVCDVMRPGLFAPNQFDVICMFQVLDHIPDPAELLDECFALLKPGGFVLSVNHDVGAISARLLGERSPIIDIEHTYLYSQETMAQIFTMHGFQIAYLSSVRNYCSTEYLVRLLPLPGLLKRLGIGILRWTEAGRLTWLLPLGNLCLLARKPGGGGAVS